MENPYETPKADLIGPGKANKSKILWKIFFYFMLGLEVLSLVLEITEPVLTSREILVELIIYPILLLGLYGYSHNKRIFNNKFWAIWIPVNLIFDTYHLFNSLFLDPDIVSNFYVTIITLCIITPLFTLQYIALYNYSFKSNNIWNAI